MVQARLEFKWVLDLMKYNQRARVGGIGNLERDITVLCEQCLVRKSRIFRLVNIEIRGICCGMIDAVKALGPSLQSLTITTGLFDLKKLTEGLANCHALTTLVLRGVEMSLQESREMGRHLPQTLEEINFASMNITPEKMANLAPGIVGCKNLRRLNLSGVNPNLDGRLVGSVLSQLGQLEEAVLGGEECNIDEAAFLAIVDGLVKCTGLKTLKITNLDWVAVSRDDVNATAAQQDMLRLIVSHLTRFEQLEILDLDGGWFSGHVFDFFADLRVGQLRELSLTAFGLTDDGFRAACLMCERAKALEFFDADRNEITGAGLEALLRVDAECPTMECVSLLGNEQILHDELAALERQLSRLKLSYDGDGDGAESDAESDDSTRTLPYDAVV